ncbi:MAG: aminotransferase class V-fold PLP-dependent enzyme [candidate division Zixibacteria bacterium]|nr:aminotransferase class V-fold PLP-dependent enzyme [candidate division Zixibacteria bacterium]
MTAFRTQDKNGQSGGAGITRRGFLGRGLAAAGGAAALSMTGWAARIDEALAKMGPPAGPEDDAFWLNLRSQFPFEPNLAYMNNGGLGASPQPVIDAVIEGYRAISASPGVNLTQQEDHIEEVIRPEMAKFIGADTDEVAFTRNATEGLNIIANGVDMKPGDEVLTTTHEHPAGIEPWLLKSQRYGIVVRQVRLPSPPESVQQVIDTFRNAMTERTKVLFFCHITRGPGLLYPAKELCALAREHGIISAVDAAQSVGMMDVNMHDMGCDLMANSLHKWLLAPIGSGVLYVRKDIQPKIFPLFSGAGQWDIAEAGGLRYEAVGTNTAPIQMGIGAALKYINAIGIKQIEARNRMLSDYLKAEISKVPGVRLMTSTSHELSSPGITTIEIQGWQVRTFRRLMQDKFNVTVSSDNRDHNNGIRISTHFYNTTQDIDKTVQAVKSLLQSSI